jgi:hypothetical protein
VRRAARAIYKFTPPEGMHCRPAERQSSAPGAGTRSGLSHALPSLVCWSGPPRTEGASGKREGAIQSRAHHREGSPSCAGIPCAQPSLHRVQHPARDERTPLPCAQASPFSTNDVRSFAHVSVHKPSGLLPSFEMSRRESLPPTPAAAAPLAAAAPPPPRHPPRQPPAGGRRAGRGGRAWPRRAAWPLPAPAAPPAPPARLPAPERRPYTAAAVLNSPHPRRALTSPPTHG